MSDWIVGQAARISVTAKDFSGALADPGALRFKIKSPLGTVTSLTYGIDAAIVRDSLGKFHVDRVFDAVGSWSWRWELDAPNAGATEGSLIVNRSTVI